MREDLEADEPLRQTTALLQVHSRPWMHASLNEQPRHVFWYGVV